MKVTIEVVIQDDQGQIHLEELIQLDKGIDKEGLVGLSLAESKQLVKELQNVVVQHQAQAFTEAHRCCPHCQKPRRIKGRTTIQYRTLFGIVSIPNQRLYHCACTPDKTRTFSILNEYIVEHNSPELQYMETKWASLMSYGVTVDLLKEVLPINDALDAETIRRHLHRVAKRHEETIQDTPRCVSGCQHEWEALPKPDKPLTVGIDGGYVKHCHDKKNNFEVIVGKCFSKTQPSKRMGFVQTLEDNPRRRLMQLLDKQGMQANQQITFLSDGGDSVRELQYIMHPEAEHLLDWFHVTMRLTVANQFTKGLEKSDPEQGAQSIKQLDSVKWYLWHGNVDNALEKLEDCYLLIEGNEIQYENKKKFLKHLNEMDTYIRNNRHLIPNYGEKYRFGETITTAFVESTVNEVVAKRMVKKQQMQWSPEGAHCLLQTRTSVLNDELRDHFEAWYPAMKKGSTHLESTQELPMAA